MTWSNSNRELSVHRTDTNFVPNDILKEMNFLTLVYGYLYETVRTLIINTPAVMAQLVRAQDS